MALIFFLAIFTLLGVRCGVDAGAGPPPGMMNEVEDNSRYKTLEANATLFKLLVNNKTGVSRSEVFDMLHSRDDNVDHMDLPTFPQDTDDINPDVNLEGSETEYLQATGSKVAKDDSMRLRAPPTGTRGEPVGVAAAIMVGITCTVVCAAYATLIIWRRIDMKRNGLKHELLRNEDNIAETRIEL